VNRILLEVAIASLAALALYVMFNKWQAADKRADIAEAALVVQAANEKVVTKYVDKIVTVEKRIPGAVKHIYSLCEQPAVVSGASDPDAAATADARDRRIAGLAADSAACRQNAEQLSALQEVLRPQLK
jgi:hypothetical protein